MPHSPRVDLPRVLRVLAPAPASFRAAGAAAPAFGAYAGPLPPVDLGSLGLRDRVARRKRWVYIALATPGVWISVAIVRTGYAATAFAFAYDLHGQRMMLDRTALGPAPVARVGDDFHAPGEIARFAMGKSVLALTRRDGILDLHVRMRDLEIDASIEEASGPPAITAIANLGLGLVNATEKRALLAVSGRARSGNREMILDGGTAGYDYTHGLMPRHTKWRWAYGLGKTKAGEPFGLNLVQGFVGEAECAAFVSGQVVPLAEPRFEFDAAQPLRQWRVVGEGIDLAFEPGGMHTENTNLGIVKSRFVQPVGIFTGTVRAGDRDLYVEGLPGVVEDQDCLW